jgi:hypothetical protein
MWLFTNPLSQGIPLALVFEVVFIIVAVFAGEVARDEPERWGRIFMQRVRRVFLLLVLGWPFVMLAAVLTQQ